MSDIPPWFSQKASLGCVPRHNRTTCSTHDDLSILIICGYDSSEEKFFNYSTMCRALDVNHASVSITFCKTASQTKEILSSFFDLDGSKKAIIYIGHGAGGCSSFAFDLSGKGIGRKEDATPTMVTTLIEGSEVDEVGYELLYMPDVINIAENGDMVKELYVFICACSSLSANHSVNFF